MPSFDIAIFCYKPHEHLLERLIRSIQTYIVGYNKIKIVYDNAGTCRVFKNEKYLGFDVHSHSAWSWTSMLWAHGWIRQQILKLQCHTFSEAEYTWVIDSDILLLKPFSLFDAQSQLPFLRYTTQPIDTTPLQCYDFMQKYFGIKQIHPMVIANGGGNCVFDHVVLEAMSKFMLDNHNCTLAQLLDEQMHKTLPVELNQHRGFPLREFEIYGNWVHQNCPERVKIAEPNWSLHNNDQDIRVF